MEDSALNRARRLWPDLAGVPVRFPDHGVVVVTAAGSRLCPPGWVGVVTLADAALITVPDDNLRDALRTLAGRLPVAALVDADRLGAALTTSGITAVDYSVDELLGPTALSYLDHIDFRPVADPLVESVSSDGLEAMLASVPADDADECGLDEITSSAFVRREQGKLVAAAGYRRWSTDAAHLCVLTAPGYRGRGLARAVASAAVADALTHGLLPQWRARVEASRRVADALGFREYGTQLSLLVSARFPGATEQEDDLALR